MSRIRKIYFFCLGFWFLETLYVSSKKPCLDYFITPQRRFSKPPHKAVFLTFLCSPGPVDRTSSTRRQGDVAGRERTCGQSVGLASWERPGFKSPLLPWKVIHHKLLA